MTVMSPSQSIKAKMGMLVSTSLYLLLKLMRQNLEPIGFLCHMQSYKFSIKACSSNTLPYFLPLPCLKVTLRPIFGSIAYCSYSDCLRKVIISISSSGRWNFSQLTNTQSDSKLPFPANYLISFFLGSSLAQSESSPLLTYFWYFLPSDQAMALYMDQSAPAPLILGLKFLRLMHFQWYFSILFFSIQNWFLLQYSKRSSDDSGQCPYTENI